MAVSNILMMKRFLLVVMVLPALIYCNLARNLSQIGEVEEEGHLVVITRESPISYFVDADGDAAGYEHDLVLAFARDHGLEVKFKNYATTTEVLTAMRAGQGHIAAAGLTKTKEREEEFLFSRTYKTTKLQVVCGKKYQVNNFSDLEKLSFLVPADTSYEAQLEEIAERLTDLAWENLNNQDSEEVLAQLWENREECTLVDSTILGVHRQYFPELRVLYTFPEDQEYGWVLNPVDEDLVEKIDEWMRGKGIVVRQRLDKKYYSHRKPVDHYDLSKFKKRIESRLTEWKELFKKAGSQNGIDWRMLAAISYQESQWDPKAVSPTGVKGLMMLTRHTAEELGVKNRLDPEASIMGGARYLLTLMKRIPPYVKSSDRLWFALAAYNVGYSHLRDAMSLAVQQNLNPTRWKDVRAVLPLLSKARYHRRLPYGYARGLEPVIYVDRIRNFYRILKRD